MRFVNAIRRFYINFLTGFITHVEYTKADLAQNNAYGSCVEEYSVPQHSFQTQSSILWPARRYTNNFRPFVSHVQLAPFSSMDFTWS